MVYLLLVQALAVIAVIFFLWSFHTKSRKNILLLQLISLVFWGTHFFMLSAFTGAVLIVINGLVTVLFLFKERKPWLKSPLVLYSALSLFTIFTVITWTNFYSLFALFAVGTITFAKWQDIPERIRIVSIPASIFWIIYDFVSGAWGSIIAEILIIISIVISLSKK